MLTNKQKKILDAIKSFIEKHSFPPTIEELRKIVGIQSKSTIHTHLTKLREKGYVDWWDGSPRTFQILKHHNGR